MKLTGTNSIIAVVATIFLGGSAYAAAHTYWRPVSPKFVIVVRSADHQTNTLLLTYGERGADPFSPGTNSVGRRYSFCTTAASLCVSPPARNEFRTEGARRQSLQVRLLGRPGNPIVDGVIWSGRAYPDEVHLACDLSISDPRRSCAIREIRG